MLGRFLLRRLHENRLFGVHIKDIRMLSSEGRMTCSLSVFESRVLSVMLEHERELIRGESSKEYYD